DVGIDCSPRTDVLANGESEVFSSVTNRFLGGVRGYATFMMNDNASTSFTIYWDTPLIGFHGHYVIGLPTKNYRVALQHGFDDTVFQITVTPVRVYSIDWRKFFLALSFIGGVSVILFCCGLCITACSEQDSTLSRRINSEPQRYLATSTPSYHSY